MGEVFFTVKRQKQTIFMDAKEETTVENVKKMLQGVTRRSPDEMQVFYKSLALEDNKTLADCGITAQDAKAQTPAELGMAYKLEDGTFEELEISPVSAPELPQNFRQGRIV